MRPFKIEVSALECRGTRQNDVLDRSNYITLRLQGRVRQDNDENYNGQANHSVFCLTLPTGVTIPCTSPSRFPTWTRRLGLTLNTSTIGLETFGVRPWQGRTAADVGTQALGMGGMKRTPGQLDCLCPACSERCLRCPS